MKLNSLVTKQANPSGGSDVVTDILNDATTTYQYKGAYETGTGNFNFEFDLESLHFVVTTEGTPCTVEAQVELTYQDGTTIRRQLRRQLGGKNENVMGSFVIFDENAIASGQEMLPETTCMLKMAGFGVMGLMTGYHLTQYFQRKGDRVEFGLMKDSDFIEM